MTKTYCDVCGKEIKGAGAPLVWDKDVFHDQHDYPIEDICPNCYWTLLACLFMMKETGWKPDFHEKLESGHIHDRDIAGDILGELRDKTGMKF